MAKYAIMQSGFLSLDDVDLATPTEYGDLVISNVLSKDYRSPSNLYFYSPNVVKLYRHWLGDANCIKEFDFRERIILAAQQVFKTNSLQKWLTVQNKHASLSKLHQMFIIDTLEYLKYGRRRIEITQWVALVEQSNKTESVVVDLSSFFATETVRSPMEYLPTDINKLIGLWSIVPDGLLDLLITMMVIFGNRPHISDVSENPKKK